MTNRQDQDRVTASPMSIAAVEADCGIPKDTLRAWERRYGFPAPLRDDHNDRVYPPEQVVQLRLLRRLIAAGHRPSKVVGRQPADLSAMLKALSAGASCPVTAEAREVLGLLGAYRANSLARMLTAEIVRHGLAAFAGSIAPELAQAVGNAWSCGELEIHQEHLFTQQLTAVLRAAIDTVANAGPTAGAPQVLLTTFPQEPHALGLLMAEAMFILQGCSCVVLGPQTPIKDIAAAAAGHHCDIVALSFSACMTTPQVGAGLEELRATLPPDREIWAGGACRALHAAHGLIVLRSLSEIETALASWKLRTSSRASAPALTS